MHPLVEIEVEIEIEAEGASQQRFHHHLSVRWTALFWEESLLQRHFHVLGIESWGFHRRHSRGWIASFLGKEVAPKATEVSHWKRRKAEPV